MFLEHGELLVKAYNNITKVSEYSLYTPGSVLQIKVDMPQVDETKYNDQSSLRGLIRRERRVELALEGLRWFDIQRWEIGPETMNKTIYGTRLGTVNPENGNLNLEGEHVKVEERYFDPGKNYLWPIPQKEIDVNDNLDQNPGF